MTALPRIWLSPGGVSPRLIALALAAATVVVALPLPFAIVTVGGAVALVLSVANPGLALALIAFSVPFGSPEALSFGDFNLSATEAVVVLGIIGWGIKAARERTLAVDWTRLALPTAILLLVMLLKLPEVRLQISLLKDVLKWGEFLAIYLLAVNLIRTKTQVIAIVVSVLAAGVIAALHGWIQFLFQVGPEAFEIGGRYLRAFGTFGQPNPYAGYLSIVAIFPIATLIQRWRAGYAPIGAKRRWGWGEWALACVLGVMMLAVLMTLSRGAWTGLAVATVVLLSMVSRRGLVVALSVVLAIVMFGLSGVVDLLPPEIAERFSGFTEYFQVFDARSLEPTPETWAVVERMAIWQSAWQMFQENWLLGIGAAQFGDAYPDYALPFWRFYPAPHAHNYFLNQLVETGIIGLVVYVWLSITALGIAVAAWRQLRRRPGEPMVGWLPVTPEALALGAVGMLIYVHAHGFFDNMYVHGITAQIGLGIGLAQAVRRW